MTGTGRFAGPIIRGWRYGLIDGNPHYTSAVFRRDRFGQFRDMLEQRINSTTILDAKNSPINYLGDVETPAMPLPPDVVSFLGTNEFGETLKEGTIFRPVTVSFVKQSISPENKLIYPSVLPTNTWSSNLSMYATSSLPYFDDIGRNRSKLPDVVLNTSYYTTII
jgi:hypothetical protein